MDFKKWWKKKTMVIKSVVVGIFISFFLSFLHLLIFTLIPSLIEGKLICSTFADGGQCGSILGFFIFSMIVLISGVIYLLIPCMLISVIIVGIIRLIKRRR